MASTRLTGGGQVGGDAGRPLGDQVGQRLLGHRAERSGQDVVDPEAGLDADGRPGRAGSSARVNTSHSTPERARAAHSSRT